MTPKIAIIHDWFVSFTGAEKVVEQILIVYPSADLYSIVNFLPHKSDLNICNKHIKTTFIQNMPFANKFYRLYSLLFPLAIESLDVSDYDIIISSSSSVSKGVIVGPDQLHICYCHSPVRYAWDLQFQYLRSINNRLARFFAFLLMHYYRIWDSRTSNSVDHFISNSKYIARRVLKAYRRDSDVIYPPVNVESMQYSPTKSNYYLVASRLVPYKKIDLIIKAFNLMPHLQLVVIGDGPKIDEYKMLANKNIDMRGWVSDEELGRYMSNAKAFVFAAEEDFGIVVVEAQAAGTPVIAYAKGGATETVIDHTKDSPTGIYFNSQHPASIVDAVTLFESKGCAISSENCRRNSLKFSDRVFRYNFQSTVDTYWESFKINKLL